MGTYKNIAGRQVRTAMGVAALLLSDDLFYTKGRHALKLGTLINNYDLYDRGSKLLYGGHVQ